MADEGTTAGAPACPGCHFGCPLDAYRCGRGKGFSERWRAGEPVPERRMPPQGGGSGRSGRPGGEGGEGGHPAPPVSVHVMHGLNIMANVLQGRHTESAERKVLASIARQGGFLAASLLAKRTLVDQMQLDEAVADLVGDGLLERVDEPIAGPVLRITEAGRAHQAEWNAEHEAATADFLSPLTEEEQDQLARLLFQLISHQKRE